MRVISASKPESLRERPSERLSEPPNGDSSQRTSRTLSKQHLQKCLHHPPKISHLALPGHLARVPTLSSSWVSSFSALLPFSPSMRKDRASSRQKVKNLSNARQVLGCARERRARRLIYHQDGQLSDRRKGRGDGKKITMVRSEGRGVSSDLTKVC